MSHPRKQTLILLITTEIAENKRPTKLSPLQWSKFKPIVGLTSHCARVLKISKI
jgi:hypothetical protein